LLLFWEMFKIAASVVGGGFAIAAVADDVFSRRRKWTEEGEIVYEVFAIYATDPISTSYVTEFASDEEYVNWLNLMYEQSVVKPPVELNADTQVLTLSTCINDSRNRLIIQAKRITP